MVRVCIERYPKGTCKHQKKDGFYFHEMLKVQLDLLIAEIANDWDYTIIIAGDGGVRVGKSMLAMQIGAYICDQLNIPFTLEHNFVFDGQKLIEKGHWLGQRHPGSPLIYDEAGADLEARKVMTGSTRQVLDYFRECGQYNLFNILVLPDYFDLPKGIALSRSWWLINVKTFEEEDGRTSRGYFDLYSRSLKKKLYLLGKKTLDYSIVKSPVQGRFTRFYPIDEKAYRELKQQALLNRRGSVREQKWLMQRNAALLMCNEKGIPEHEISYQMTLLTGISLERTSVSSAIVQAREVYNERTKS